MSQNPREHTPSWRRICAWVGIIGLGLALGSCDKCGNSIFGSNAGPLVCANKLPQ